MKGMSAKNKKEKFAADFKSILVFSLIANAKKLRKDDLKYVKDCIGKNCMAKALKVVESKYSPSQWRDYVNAQAKPILKEYMVAKVKV